MRRERLETVVVVGAAIALALLGLGTSRWVPGLFLAAVAIWGWLWLRSVRGRETEAVANRLASLAPDVPRPDSADLIEHVRAILDARRQDARTAQAEYAVARDEQAHLLRALTDAVLIVSDQGKILQANAAMASVLARDSSSLVGLSTSDVFTQQGLLDAIERAQHAGSSEGEIRISGPGVNGTVAARVLRVKGERIKPAGEGMPGRVLLVLHDITAERGVGQLKSDFVANASHEFRTPTATIRGAVEALLDGAQDEPKMRERLLRMIETHSLRLEEMIRDTLDLSRMESGQSPVRSSPLDPETLAHTLRTTFEETCKQRGVELRVNLDSSLQSFQTDSSVLALILRNLADNAIRFSDEGKPVAIHGKLRSDGWAVFEVSDKGVGIPLDQQQRIFERFYQVDPARTGGNRRGTGLGLAIVKHAIGRLRGSIGVQSVWKQGTTMRVEIPPIDTGPVLPRDPSSPRRETAIRDS